jgi:hypothetical protein
MDFDLDDVPLIDDLVLTMREEGDGGLHIELTSRSQGRLAGFPAWDRADRDLRHFTPDDIPLGSEDEPFAEVDDAWRIVIFARGNEVFVFEGDAPLGPLPRRYRIPRQLYLAAWDALMQRFNPALSLEDVLGAEESVS